MAFIDWGQAMKTYQTIYFPLHLMQFLAKNPGKLAEFCQRHLSEDTEIILFG